jgi:hypothetical protein
MVFRSQRYTDTEAQCHIIYRSFCSYIEIDAASRTVEKVVVGNGGLRGLGHEVHRRLQLENAELP